MQEVAADALRRITPGRVGPAFAAVTKADFDRANDPPLRGLVLAESGAIIEGDEGLRNHGVAGPAHRCFEVRTCRDPELGVAGGMFVMGRLRSAPFPGHESSDCYRS